MTNLPHIHKTQNRIHHANNTFSDYITVRFPADSLHLVDVDQHNPRIKLEDIAHLRYFKACARGEREPIIVAFLRLEHDQPVSVFFPHISTITESGETLLSSNSLITYTMRVLLERGWVRYQKGNWHVTAPDAEKEWQKRGQAVIALLTEQNRLHLEVGPERVIPEHIDFSEFSFDVYKNLIPIDRCAFLSDVVYQQRPRFVFNTAFFLLEHDDFFSHHSGLGEAFNIWITDGVIHRPPLYRRGAIFQHKNKGWEVGLLGMDDIVITLPNNIQLAYREVAVADNGLRFSLNDEDLSDVMLYTRYYGVAGRGQVLGFTPTEEGRFELTVVDRRIVSWATGGGLALPQNGFVISFASGALTPETQSDLQRILKTQNLLYYHFAQPKYQDIVQAVQNGSILLQAGQSPLTDTYLEAKEQFWASRTLEDGTWQIGVVSTDYATNINKTRHGRVGLGIDEEGDLILVMVAGVNRGMEVPGIDSDGATLGELTQLLCNAGSVSAVNLDGGGSTQAYYYGGRALVVGDRRGNLQLQYERMVPSVGIVL